MEHYDWNDGWLFAPTFDPAIVHRGGAGAGALAPHGQNAALQLL